jgi:RecA-family ATPase
VSLTAGPGGMGKSSLDLVEAIAMATCRNLLGEQPEERLRVWYHNGEDPLDEINRRIAAICQHHSIPQEELAGWLWVTSGNEFPLRVAKGYSSLEINSVLVRQISAAISDNRIDVAIFDPLVTLHSVSEMDPGKMDAVIRVFAGIADENDAGIELAHHMRKPAAGAAATDYDVHDIRGVGAITDAVRAARVLNRMNEKDAEAAGCTEPERLSRFRVDRAKGNYSPAQAATWRQFVSVELANGDDVGVVAPWNFPGQGERTPEKAAADQKAEHVFLQLLDKFLARGINVSAKVGPNYAPSKFAEEREATTVKVAKAALKGAMNRLLDAGRIRAEPFGRGDRPSQHRLIPWQGTPASS